MVLVIENMPECDNWLSNFHNWQKWVRDVDKDAAVS